LCPLLLRRVPGLHHVLQSMPPLTPDLIESYERALYALESGMVLRVGVGDSGLERLLEHYGAAAAAFVTAANPRGEVQEPALNQAAMAALRSSLALPWLPGEGRDPEGRWRPEPSVLVLGITASMPRRSAGASSRTPSCSSRKGAHPSSCSCAQCASSSIRRCGSTGRGSTAARSRARAPPWGGVAPGGRSTPPVSPGLGRGPPLP